MTDLQAIQARLDAYATSTKPRHLKFLKDALASYVEVSQNTEGRWLTGLKEIDMRTRGFGPSELVMLTGFAHGGKTQLALTGLVNNRHLPQLFFTFDEPAELVLAKLAAITLHIPSEELEAKVKANDAKVLDALNKLVEVDFPNLVLIDEPISLDEMTKTVEEFKDHFGQKPAITIVDYLELLQCGETEVTGKAQALKRWTKKVGCPVMVIHQAGRGKAADGKELTLTSMRYGGEAEATFVVGVYRKRDNPELMLTEDNPEYHSVNVKLLKSKRPPCRLGEHSYYLNQDTGEITDTPPMTPPKPTLRQQLGI